ESGYLNLINDQLNDLSRKIENTASKIEKYGSEDSFMGSGLNPDKPIDQMTDGEINRLIEQKRKIHDQKGGH
ncbi:MAG: hypothetical protein JXB19_01740, partial [Bacteroidales bacterium]|nr:hypothetical protein [Bacteroidales bacterium]